MNAMRRRVGLFLASATAAAALWACTATRNSDGSWTFEFAPDMTITAMGLEDALDKLIDLHRACLDGSFRRPCTPEETSDIHDTIKEVLRRKERMSHPRSPGSGGTVVV